MPNTPKPPSQGTLDKLSEYRVDFMQGKVYNRLGHEVGSLNNGGRCLIGIYSQGRTAHILRCHIVFWAFHDRWPEQEIDHWNRIKTDDSISNIRESTRSENCSNRYDRDLPAGVYPDGNSIHKPYKAKYKGKHLGVFHTVEEALVARERAISTDMQMTDRKKAS